MYCQHCGLDVKITEKKLQKEDEALKSHYENLLASYKKELEATNDEEKKAELEKAIFDLEQNLKDMKDNVLAFSSKVQKAYVCPRCSHLIKEHLDEEDKKELSQASHAALHRGKNHFSTGMVFLMLGMIFTCISFLFLSMSYKATAGNQIVTNCVEFYVFIGLLVLGLVLLTGGAINAIRGALMMKKYRNLLNDIQNDTFYQ